MDNESNQYDIIDELHSSLNHISTSIIQRG